MRTSCCTHSIFHGLCIRLPSMKDLLLYECLPLGITEEFINIIFSNLYEFLLVCWICLQLNSSTWKRLSTFKSVQYFWFGFCIRTLQQISDLLGS